MNICLKINYLTSYIKALLRPPASAPDLSSLLPPEVTYNMNAVFTSSILAHACILLQ